MNLYNEDLDEDFLSLKERILLLQNRKGEDVRNTASSSPVVKHIHSISDSEESNCNGKESDSELDLPPLNCLPTISRSHEEVVFLSDSEDEGKEICKVFKDIDSPQKCYGISDPVDLNEGNKVIKASKRTKKSLSKCNIDKEIIKQEKLKLKEEKKKEKELAKALKLSEKELQKSKKPDECLKAMRVIIDHNFISENGSQDIFFALDEGNVKYSIEESPVNFSVAWSKTVTDVTIEDNQLLKKESEEFENNLIVLLPNSSFIKMCHAYMQKSKGKDTCEPILSDFIANISVLFPQMTATCTISGLDSYLRSLKENETCDVELKKIAKQVSKSVIEEAIVEVQLQSSVNFIFVNNMREFGELIFRFTRAIAEAPQKKEKQMQKDLAFSWYADGDTSCPVKLGKDRSTFVKLWQQQLQQFQNVGLETAEAISAVYPSPQSLLKAYKRCNSVNEAEKLLQDIVVRRSYGPLGTQRRIGPELSFKIHSFFTSRDGNQILQR